MLSFMFYMFLVLFVICIVIGVQNSILQSFASFFHDIGDAAKTIKGMTSKTKENKKDAGNSDSDDNNNPNKWGSDAWWEEQKKFIDDSLYINHDWDIFKKEEEECDAEHCHDPYHHHEK